MDLPVDCSELIDLVVKLDHRINERKGERTRNDNRLVYMSNLKKDSETKPPDPEPMQIGGLRGPLTQEEKERRRKLLLCLYCGKPGHFARDCSVRPKGPRKVNNVMSALNSLPEN